MNFEWFIAKRIHAGNQSGYSAPMVRIAVISVALGLAVMIVSVAVVVGFKHSISAKVSGFAAPLKVVPYDRNNSYEEQPLTFSDSLLQSLKEVQGVTHVQITAQKGGVLKTDTQIQGVVLKGVGSDYDWTFLKKSLVQGRIPDVSGDKTSGEVLVSERLAKMLYLKTGDPVRIWFISGTAGARGRKLVVSGIYRTSLEEFDNRYLIGDIRHIQKLNGWKPNQAGSIELLVADRKKIREVADKLYYSLPFDITVTTVMDEYPEIYNWLDLLDANVAVILVLMVLVAGITMVSTLFIMIIERTSMVGLLKALGAHDGSLRRIFLYKASAVIVKGMLFGNAVALLFYFLQEKFHLIKLDPVSYYVDYVPLEITVYQILLINAGAFAVSLLILVVPSYAILKITPSKALRYE